MLSKIIPIRCERGPSDYPIRIAADAFPECGGWATRLMHRRSGKIGVVSNKKVYGLYGEAVIEAFKAAGFTTAVHLIGDGERFKNLSTLERTLEFFSEEKLTRTDAVVALGGGVVGDVTGFAASVYLRGIALIQMPTSLLAMIDSSVGGKTGVNSRFGKNLIGSFYQPKGVLIDPGVLRTLPERELTAGFCEAIKHGAIGGKDLLLRTSEILDAFKASDATNIEFASKMIEFLAAQVSFKASIVEGDEREDPQNIGFQSRKILNFGHTFAHALEKATNFRYFKHGEAVGHGILFAAELSKTLELLGQNQVNLLYDVVHRVGNLPKLDSIDPELVLGAFQHDKKLVNDSLHWILLKDIGKPVIVSNNKIPQSAVADLVRRSIRK